LISLGCTRPGAKDLAVDVPAQQDECRCIGCSSESRREDDFNRTRLNVPENTALIHGNRPRITLVTCVSGG
jgi:hypothetical protein